MSVTTQDDSEEPLVHSQFNLPTHQRRLRHLQSITARNLVFPSNRGIDIIDLQVYFTLHKDTKSEAFYTSEKITGSLNATWQSFDLQRSDSDTELASKFVVVRVWVGVRNEFQLKIEWQVHLSGLVLFSDKLQVAGLKHGPDTLLFGMYNHIFCYLDLSAVHPQLEQLVPDSQIPQSQNLHAVLMDRSLLRPSYNTNYLSRIHTVLRAIKQTHASVRRIHSTIEDKLVSSKERSDKLSQREALLIRMRQLRQELFWQQQQKQKDEDELIKCEEITKAKARQLKSKRASLTQFCTDFDEKKSSHIQYREMLVKENAQVLFRRRQLISEIVQHIYPMKKKEKEDFYICNVRLPNAEEYQGHDENQLAAALGFVCHLTLMVSQFLDTPLRYAMVHKGSRSTIIDQVHSKLLEKDREFPLYGKGKEKFQFNYAVFLLNKNISQMRFYLGLGTSDLRQTLYNLKSLLEQRLGFGSAMSPSHRGPYNTNLISNNPSLENSLASHMSMGPSSSSSSFIPHPNYHQHQQHHHHNQKIHLYHTSESDGSNAAARHTQHHPDRLDLSSLEISHQHRTSYPADSQAPPLIFKNSREDSSSGANGSSNNNNAMDSSFSSWIESASKMAANNGTNGRLNGAGVKEGGECRDENEDDEKDDLFESSEDSFFSSAKHPPMTTELLNNGTGTTTTTNIIASSSSSTNNNMGTKKNDSSDVGNDNDAAFTVNTTLSPTPNMSFKLFKQKPPQPPQSSKTNDENTTDDNNDHNNSKDSVDNNSSDSINLAVRGCAVESSSSSSPSQSKSISSPSSSSLSPPPPHTTTSPPSTLRPISAAVPIPVVSSPSHSSPPHPVGHYPKPNPLIKDES